MRALARVTALAALCGACAPEPEAPPPLFDVVPVAAARGRPGVVTVSISTGWFSTPRVRPGAPLRQPGPLRPLEVHFDSVRLVVSNIRLGRVATEAGGRRVISTVARDPRAFAVEWEDDDPAGPGASRPLTAFALAADAPATAWDATYAVSFDVGSAPGLSPVHVIGEGRAAPRGVGGTHEVEMHFHTAEGWSGGPVTVARLGGDLRLDAPASFLDCMNPQDGADARGVRLRRDGAARAELNFHPDHLFWTALRVEGQRAEPALIAAAPLGPSILDYLRIDATLSRVDVTGLVGPGDLPLTLNGARPVRTLLDFVTESVRTAVHFNGDGRCTVLPRAAP